MVTRRWTMRIIVLLATCLALALSTSLVAAEGGIVEGSVTSTAYGTFNGVPYIQYKGRLYSRAGWSRFGH